MIKRRKVGENYQYYLFVGGLYSGWYTLNELSKLPECVVDKKTLSNRLSKVSSIGGTINFRTVFQCLTWHKENDVSPMKKLRNSKTVDRDKFLLVLNLWPAGSYHKTVR